MEIKVIYRDKNFIALDKPSGLLIHKSDYQKTDKTTLADWIIKNFPQTKKVGDFLGSNNKINYRPGIVHRLDKETSGIIIVALNQDYFKYLKSLFASKQISKSYLAIVKGELKEKSGEIDKPIGIKPGTTRRTVYSSKMSKEAKTLYSLKSSFEKDGEDYSLVLARPLTGRTHQIRVHLNFIGHPIIGDPLYGGKQIRVLSKRLMLHSFSIEFKNEDGKMIKLETPPPDDFMDFFPSDFDKNLIV